MNELTPGIAAARTIASSGRTALLLLLTHVVRFDSFQLDSDKEEIFTIPAITVGEQAVLRRPQSWLVRPHGIESSPAVWTSRIDSDGHSMTLMLCSHELASRLKSLLGQCSNCSQRIGLHTIEHNSKAKGTARVMLSIEDVRVGNVPSQGA